MTDFKEGQEVWVRCEFCEYAGANQAFVLIQGEGALAQLYDIKDSEPKKVTIPKFVAEWIEYCKYNSLTLLGAFEPVSEHGIGLANTFTGEVRKCIDWAKRNQDIFARAWLDGYGVEPEKLYNVIVADQLLVRTVDKGFHFYPINYTLVGHDHRFTEHEIKEYEPRLMEFAKEVNNEKR